MKKTKTLRQKYFQVISSIAPLPKIIFFGLGKIGSKGCIERAGQEFLKSKGGIDLGAIYAIDFDGVLCEKKYPKIGAEITGNIDFVKQLAADGNTLILWTCREGQVLDDAINWCDERDLKFDAVNENLERTVSKYGTNSRKVFADYYVDDKNYSIQIDDSNTRKKLLKKIDSIIK